MSYKNLYSDPIFSNFPKKIDRTIYEEIRFNTVKKLKKIGGVQDVFYCGNIDTPGISDLDFFAITNENNIDFKKVFLLYKNFNEVEKYTAGLHYPFFVPRSIGMDYKYILPLSNINHYDIKKYDSKHVKIQKEHILLIVGELILEFYPRTFLHKLITGDIDVRKTFMSLKSFRFPINYCNELNIFKNKKNIEKYLEDFEILKDGIFTLPKNKFLDKLYLQTILALKISFEMIHDLNEYLKMNYEFKLPKKAVDVYYRSIFSDKKYHIHFEKTVIYKKNTTKQFCTIQEYFKSSYTIDKIHLLIQCKQVSRIR